MKDGTCIWSTCNRPTQGGQSLCMAHARRKWVGSPPMDAPIRANRRGMPLVERVMEQTTREGECVIFTGSKTTAGYGKIGTKNGMLSAMKVVWEHRHGPVPQGMLIRHTCDNPPCVDIDHLIIGTAKDNTRDMMLRGRSPLTSFTPDQVRIIRVDPRAQQVIANEYGVHQTTISAVQCRKTYDWVDD